MLNENEQAEYIDPNGYARIGKKQLDAHGRLIPVDEFLIGDNPGKEIIQQWKEFLVFSNALEQAGIDVVNYSVQDQERLWKLFESGDVYIEVSKFIGREDLNLKDKQARLKTLLSVGSTLTDISRIGEIGNERDANFLFLDMAQIADVTSSFEEFVSNSNNYSDEERTGMQEISEAIMEQAGRLFLGAYEVAKADNNIGWQDVSAVLTLYREQVYRWYSEEFLRSVDPESNFYLGLLNTFRQAESASDSKAVLLSMIQRQWNREIVNEALTRHSSTSTALERIRAFYEGNKELFKTSSETTGDTAEELRMLDTFLESLPNGDVLDFACGNGERITKHMADSRKGKGKVYGVDLWLPPADELPQRDNLEFFQGSIERIPLETDSVDAITLNWSPPNDWVERTEQKINFNELGRVLKPGGKLRSDQAYLEGGAGSWLPTVEDHFVSGKAEKFGDMKVVFPGGREGEFHIYPVAELEAHLMGAGFKEIEFKVWITKSGKPRVVFTAQYEGSKNPIT